MRSQLPAEVGHRRPGTVSDPSERTTRLSGRSSAAPRAGEGAGRRLDGRAGLAAALVGVLLTFGPGATLAPASTPSGVARATTANDSDGYRYWSFWTHDPDAADESDTGGWRYGSQGPAQLRPADGDVVGFRFTASRSADDGATPRPAADFERICADTEPADGRKRIALVIDPGTTADAPAGEKPPAPRTACAQVGSADSAAHALAAEAPPLRYDSSALLCAIEDYPRTGCGERLSGGEDQAPSEQDDSEGSAEEEDGATLPLFVGVLAVLVLAAGAGWQLRRRRP